MPAWDCLFPRVLEDLIDQGIHIGRKRVARLMQAEGLKGRVRKRYRSTTMSDHNQPIAANVLAALGCRGQPRVTRERLPRRNRPRLAQQLLAYVKAHNAKGKPFTWTKTADEILDKIRRFGLRTQQVHGQ